MISGRKYQLAHLKAMAREEKKFNKTFGTHDHTYQNRLKRIGRRKHTTIGDTFF